MTDFDDVVRAALAIAGIESAAIFVRRPESSALELAAAAGIDGPPLDGLVAAVQNPMHPIARAMQDAGPAFDVRPMNPDGPALRSHLPLGGSACWPSPTTRASAPQIATRWPTSPRRQPPACTADFWLTSPGRRLAPCSRPRPRSDTPSAVPAPTKC